MAAAVHVAQLVPAFMPSVAKLQATSWDAPAYVNIDAYDRPSALFVSRSPDIGGDAYRVSADEAGQLACSAWYDIWGDQPFSAMGSLYGEVQQHAGAEAVGGAGRAGGRAEDLQIIPDLSWRRPRARRHGLLLKNAEVTTLMIRNVPPHVTQRQLLQELTKSGFHGMYDFVYLPCSFERKANKGYAFVNLVSPEIAGELASAWHLAHILSRTPADSPLNVSAAAVQGLAENVRKWDAKVQRIRNPDLRPYIVGVPEFAREQETASAGQGPQRHAGHTEVVPPSPSGMHAERPPSPPPGLDPPSGLLAWAAVCNGGA